MILDGEQGSSEAKPETRPETGPQTPPEVRPAAEPEAPPTPEACYYDCFCNRFVVGEHSFREPSQLVFPKEATGAAQEVGCGEAAKLACFGWCCYGPFLDVYNKCTRQSYGLDETTLMRSSAAVAQISGALVDQREKAVPWSFHEPSADQAAFPKTFAAARVNTMLQGCLRLMMLVVVTALPCNWGNCFPGCCYYACCTISAFQLIVALALNCCGAVCSPCDPACAPCAWVVRRFFNCRQSCYHSCRSSTKMCSSDIDPYYFGGAAQPEPKAHLQDCLACTNELDVMDMVVDMLRSILLDDDEDGDGSSVRPIFAYVLGCLCPWE